MTVLFADLSGFTAPSERLDPEEIRALQSDLFQEMAAVIDRYGGFVEKFVGDAVMAVFGAPVAHEDDPERAIRAAIAMHERMTVLNGRWETRVGQPLALHAFAFEPLGDLAVKGKADRLPVYQLVGILGAPR